MLKLNMVINEINENDSDFQRHIFVFWDVLTKYMFLVYRLAVKGFVSVAAV